MRSERLAWLIRHALPVLAALFVLLAGTAGYLYRLSLTLPDLDVDPDALRPAETSIVYAADGSVLGRWHGEQNRTVVPLDDVPRAMRDAVVAIEDARFYEHHGVDTRSIVRATWANADGRVREGGSTITQQLVKLLFTDGRRNLGRKIREALLAFELETKADKDRVLETYLNVVYFGSGAYGVESAAQAYLGKRASELTLPESAMLAGVISAPSRFSPLRDADAARRRRDAVLGRMRDLGKITEDERREAVAAPLGVVPPRDAAARAPYFVEWVKQQLIDELGTDAVYEGGLRVHTTLDPRLQAAAEGACRKLLPKSDDPEVALVCVEYRTGRVVALVGGRNFGADQFNLAVQGRRQPGSAFKPFVLVTALSKGVRPDESFAATPYSVRVRDGVWNVQNYENSPTAPTLTLRAATNRSVNAVYARLIMRVGAASVVKTAQRMGVTSPIEANPAIALGGLSKGVSPLEMASAYGTIASGGVATPPYAVERVTDARGRTLFEGASTGKRVIRRPVAVTASLMLHDVITSGTGTAARMDAWAAGKTGTTQSYRDAWFVGYAGEYSTSVWVGYRQAQVDMTDVHGVKVTGGSFPARIWRAYTIRALAEERSPVTVPPTGSMSGRKPAVVRICVKSMMLANKRCPDTIELYLEPSLIPETVCEDH